MINEDQLEQLAIQWFHDTGWSYAHCSSMALEGKAREHSDFGEFILKDRYALVISCLTPKFSLADQTHTAEALV